MFYPDDLTSGKIYEVDAWMRSDVTSVYIRELPESTILDKIPHQALVIYLDFAFYNDRLWYKVIYGDVVGWFAYGELREVNGTELDQGKALSVDSPGS